MFIRRLVRGSSWASDHLGVAIRAVRDAGRRSRRGRRWDSPSTWLARQFRDARPVLLSVQDETRRRRRDLPEQTPICYISAMPRAKFDLQAPFQPAGDQPKAIAELSAGLERGDRFQTLLGVTGSGKTMTMANVITQHGKPTLVLSHNKTLAAQLYGELKSFFPHNAVEYFISYYDYYQPEAYVPTTDTYIEKDASINEDIDRLRLRATSRLMERDDVIIVATVSAIYGLGDPVSYREQMVTLHDRAEDRARRHPALAGADPVQAQRRRVRARHVPRARRYGRDLPGVRGAGRSRRDVGRRDRAHLEDQRAHRRDDRHSRARRDLSGEALRHAAADARARGEAHSRRARRSGSPSCATRASCSRRSGSSRARTSTSR